MPQPALTTEDALAWLEKTSTNWRALIEAHLETLALPCDVMGVSTVGGLLQHIVAVELRYAERLAGLPQTDYAAIPFDSAEAIYATHTRAVKLFRDQLATNVDWARGSSSSLAPWDRCAPRESRSSSTRCSTAYGTMLS